jgi:hypothetical protein
LPRFFQSDAESMASVKRAVVLVGEWRGGTDASEICTREGSDLEENHDIDSQLH